MLSHEHWGQEDGGEGWVQRNSLLLFPLPPLSSYILLAPIFARPGVDHENAGKRMGLKERFHQANNYIL